MLYVVKCRVASVFPFKLKDFPMWYTINLTNELDHVFEVDLIQVRVGNFSN